MLTVENGGFQFFRGKRPVQIEVDFGLLDIHTQVTFDCLQAECLVNIILDIDIVKPEAYTSQQRTFPPLVTGNDPVVDLLDLFRGEPSADSFYNVLVVAFAVETTVDGVIIDTR